MISVNNQDFSKTVEKTETKIAFEEVSSRDRVSYLDQGLLSINAGFQIISHTVSTTTDIIDRAPDYDERDGTGMQVQPIPEVSHVLPAPRVLPMLPLAMAAADHLRPGNVAAQLNDSHV